MKEVEGNIWNSNDNVICITTNGNVKKNGELVMGKGLALQAKNKYPYLPRLIGRHVLKHGNVPYFICVDNDFYIVSLPTKNNWKYKSDINLIKKSLIIIKNCTPSHYTIAIPRPGCLNGGLNWEYVKKEIEPILDDRFTIYNMI